MPQDWIVKVKTTVVPEEATIGLGPAGWRTGRLKEKPPHCAHMFKLAAEAA